MEFCELGVSFRLALGVASRSGETPGCARRNKADTPQDRATQVAFLALHREEQGWVRWPPECGSSHWVQEVLRGRGCSVLTSICFTNFFLWTCSKVGSSSGKLELAG